jgi:hypothetical protein
MLWSNCYFIVVVFFFKMKEPLVYNEEPLSSNGVATPVDQNLSAGALEQITLTNGDVRSEDTYIVSSVQPGIYSVCIPFFLKVVTFLSFEISTGFNL